MPDYKIELHLYETEERVEKDIFHTIMEFLKKADIDFYITITNETPVDSAEQFKMMMDDVPSD